MISNVRVWTDLMSGTVIDRGAWESREFSLGELAHQHEIASNDFARLAGRIRDAGRWDDMWLDVLDDPPASKTYGGAIAHVLTHNMHHRSELLHILARLGLKELPEGDVLSWEQQAISATD